MEGGAVEARTRETGRPDARARPASASRARWCRATWLLLGTGVIWLVFVLARPVLGGSPWLARLHASLPPAAYLIVPVVLLLAVPAVRWVRTAVPVVPRRVIVALDLTALLLGGLEAEDSTGR